MHVTVVFWDHFLDLDLLRFLVAAALVRLHSIFLSPFISFHPGLTREETESYCPSIRTGAVSYTTCAMQMKLWCETFGSEVDWVTVL